MSDNRPRNRRPRTRGGKRRIADQAVIERHNKHISAIREALEPEAESLRESVPREEIVTRIRARATAMASERLEGDVDEVVEAALDDIFGLGPLEPLLRDPAVRVIHVVGADLYAGDERVERGFRDSEHAHTVMARILASVGKDVDAPGGVIATMMDGSTVRARHDGGVLVVEIRRP